MSGSRQGHDLDAVNGERDERTNSTGRRTPLRRPSPSLIQPPRPGSASRNATTTSNPRDGILRRLSYDDLTRDGSNPRTRTPLRYESPLNPPDRNATTATSTTAAAVVAVAPLRTTREGQRVTVRPLAGAAVGTTVGPRRVSAVCAMPCLRSLLTFVVSLHQRPIVKRCNNHVHANHLITTALIFSHPHNSYRRHI